MKYNDLKIQDNVKKTLQKHYGFSIISEEFIPVGEESYAYIIATNESKKYFIKYSDQKNVIEHIDLVNTLLLQLEDFDFIVPPIVINGQSAFSSENGKSMFIRILKEK